MNYSLPDPLPAVFQAAKTPGGAICTPGNLTRALPSGRAGTNRTGRCRGRPVNL